MGKSELEEIKDALNTAKHSASEIARIFNPRKGQALSKELQEPYNAMRDIVDQLLELEERISELEQE